jgi:hypothetical protein
MLFGPLEAGLIAFAGAFDARWPRGHMRPLHGQAAAPVPGRGTGRTDYERITN